jgi:GH25 family lysozyme M1 (1,4-beta-N-acetylmuramidase)
MPLTFADLSSHNTVTSWPAFLASIDAGVVKAVQGSSYVWSGAAPALAQFRAAGKPTGAYAFAGDLGPDGKVRCGDPTREADFFLANYAWRPGEVPILDFEPTILPADPDGWCAAFCARVHSRIGVAPWTYMNTGLAKSGPWAKTRATGSQLWAAQYGANSGQPGSTPAVGSWGSFVAWQYTSNGSRPGVASPPLDLSFFYGNAAAWKAHGTPGADMPLTPADLQAVHDAVWHGPGDPANADNPPVWMADRVIGTDKRISALQADVRALKGGGPVVNVDAGAVAAALAGNQTFLSALAKAVNDDAAKRLQS